MAAIGNLGGGMFTPITTNTSDDVSSTLTRTVDGDTFTVEGFNDDVRLESIDTPESVHKDDEKNTKEGAAVSEQMKTFMPVGAEVKVNQTGLDKYGRSVGGVTRIINGVEVDMGLVALDQQFSNYYTRFGKNADPFKHDQYKEYFSKHVPYQFGVLEEQMNPEDFNRVLGYQEAFHKAKIGFDEGTVTQEGLDTAMANLYGDPINVAKFRRQLAGWGTQPQDQDSKSIRGAMAQAMAGNPQLREQYNRAIRNGHLTDWSVQTPSRSLWDKMEVAREQYSLMATSHDRSQLQVAKLIQADVGASESDIIRGLPYEYAEKALEISQQNGDYAGLVYRDQAIEDIRNNKELDERGFLGQMVFSIYGTMADPTSLIPVATSVKAGAAVGRVGVTMGLNSYARNTLLMGSYAVGGATEAAYTASGRVTGGDHTYDLQQYKTDIAWGAGLGLGFGAVSEYAVQPLWRATVGKLRSNHATYRDQAAEFERAREAGEELNPATPDLELMQDEVDRLLADDEVRAGVIKLVDEDPFASLDMSEPVGVEPVDAADYFNYNARNPDFNEPLPDQLNDVGNSKTPVERANINSNHVQYDEFASITSISLQGFDNAVNTVLSNYSPKSAVYMLLKSHRGLNRELSTAHTETIRKIDADVKARELDPSSPEAVKMYQDAEIEYNHTKEVREQLNADILHIVSAYPDGKVPPAIDVAIRGVLFNQRDTVKVNALADLLGGISTVAERGAPRQRLEDYTQFILKKDELWGGTDDKMIEEISEVEETLAREGIAKYSPQWKEAVDAIKVKHTKTLDGLAARSNITAVSPDEFVSEASKWINRQGFELNEETATMANQMPDELSFVNDIVQLNKLYKDDPEMQKALGYLNGAVAVRLDQFEQGVSGTAKFTPVEARAKVEAEARQELRDQGLDSGSPEFFVALDKMESEINKRALALADEGLTDNVAPRYADNAKTYGDTAKLTPSEIKAQLESEGLRPAQNQKTLAMEALGKQLEREGLIPKTTEYSKRMKEGKGIINQGSKFTNKDGSTTWGEIILPSPNKDNVVVLPELRTNDAKYKARLAELKMDKVNINRKVNTLGKEDTFSIGDKVDEVGDEVGEASYQITDAIDELNSLRSKVRETISPTQAAKVAELRKSKSDLHKVSREAEIKTNATLRGLQDRVDKLDSTLDKLHSVSTPNTAQGKVRAAEIATDQRKLQAKLDDIPRFKVTARKPIEDSLHASYVENKALHTIETPTDARSRAAVSSTRAKRDKLLAEIADIRKNATTEAEKVKAEIRAAEDEIGSLSNSRDIEPEDRARAKELERIIASSQSDTRRTSLEADTSLQGLLPRSFERSVTSSARKNPTLTNLKQMRKLLDSRVIKPLGLKNLTGKRTKAKVSARLDKVRDVLLKDKNKVIQRMIYRGNWTNVEDVILASHKIVEEKKVRAANKKDQEAITPPKQAVEGKPETTKPVEAVTHKSQVQDAADATPLTQEDIVTLLDNNSGDNTPVVSNVQAEAAVLRMKEASDRRVQHSADKHKATLTKFKTSKEDEVLQMSLKPKGILDAAGQMASWLTTDLATKFLSSKLLTARFIGARLTELGKGYGGTTRRPDTAGILKHQEFIDSQMNFSPQYFKAMDEYAAEKGGSHWARAQAQQQNGNQNKLTKLFEREFFTAVELRRQGKTIPKNISKHVIKFADEHEIGMKHNFDKLVEGGIDGFKAGRRINNYVAHVWKSSSLKGAIQKYGVDEVRNTLAEAYKRSSTRTVVLSDKGAQRMAKEQMEWIDQLGKSRDPQLLEDQYFPQSDTRAMQRKDLDTTYVSPKGLSILDLLDTDIPNLTTRYNNRVAGWLSLARSTDGMITSPLDIETLKQSLKAEGVERGVDTKKTELWLDDTIDMLFGRPTRGGLNTEVQMMKHLTTTANMGGLGTAQLIETGNVLATSVRNTFSDPATVAKVFALAGESTESLPLIREMQSLTGLTNDLEHLYRYGTDLIDEQSNIEDINMMRQFSTFLTDKLTGGDLKPMATRLLGKVTNANAIRRYQSRMVQASLILDVSKHFKYGTGKMSKERMADLGLTNNLGQDKDLLDAFTNIAEYDEHGVLSKLNLDRWPKKAANKLAVGVLREDAQRLQQTIVGEAPPWMNKPWLALLAQFREMPIVGNNKQLARQLRFADTETVVSVLLNAAIAGMTRWAKIAAVGGTTALIMNKEWTEPTIEQMQADKYHAQLGIFPDAIDLVMDSIELAKADWGNTLEGGVPDEAYKLAKQAPIISQAAKYIELGQAISVDDRAKVVDEVFGVVPLGNIALADVINTYLQKLAIDSKKDK